MDESHVGEVARRAKVHENETRSVLSALSGILNERGAADAAYRAAHGKPAESLHPRDPRVVDELIHRAKSHPLGVEFLSKGYLDSVAAGFQAHAFTVEAAREKLRAQA